MNVVAMASINSRINEGYTEINLACLAIYALLRSIPDGEERDRLMDQHARLSVVVHILEALGATRTRPLLDSGDSAGPGDAESQSESTDGNGGAPGPYSDTVGPDPVVREGPPSTH